jgi:hypothetical protein
MARLTGVLMDANRKYLEREQEVIELHRMQANGYTGNLVTVLNNDLLLNGYSGLSKTAATLVTGMAAVIQAEIIYADFMAPESEAARQRMADLRTAFRRAESEKYRRTNNAVGGPSREVADALAKQQMMREARGQT